MQLFSKLLTKTDVEKRLTVPTNALQHLPFPVGDHFMDLRVKDTTERVWTVRCFTRRNGYPKPVFSGASWLEFVRAKGLIIDDMVIFHEEHDEATGAGYKIEVKRKIFTLMGVDIWVDVEQLHLYLPARIIFHSS